MQTIVSLIFFIILLVWVGKIFLTKKQKYRTVLLGKEEPYVLSSNMYFVIFTVCTAPIFLHGISLLKYGLWFVTILLLIFTGKIRIRFDVTTTMYLIFYLWLCYAMTYTSAKHDGMMMLVKYSLPLLFLWLGYSGLNNEKDLIILLKAVNIVACIYCFLIGGVSWKLTPWLYYGPIGGLFSRYAGFADYLTSIFIVPILLYWLTKEKKYIFCALWMVLSTVLQSVRTGMGGMMLVFAFAMFLRYKIKALPGLLFAGAFFLSIILFVPDVNKKFFGDNAGKVSATDIVQGDAMSLDNIEMSGREYLWKKLKENYYYGNELIGKGLGESEYFAKNIMYEGEMSKIHNDYLILLCDTGKIGIIFFILFYISVILKVASHVMLRRSNPLVRLTGIMALSSMAGIAFCMYFDNVVSNSMQSMVMPYIFLGFFLKALDLENKRVKKTINI